MSGLRGSLDGEGRGDDLTAAGAGSGAGSGIVTSCRSWDVGHQDAAYLPTASTAAWSYRSRSTAIECIMHSVMVVCIHDCTHHPGRARGCRAHDEDPRGSGRPVLAGYLRSLIEREAARLTVAEAVEQARRQATADISTADILAAIDEGRTGR